MKIFFKLIISIIIVSAPCISFSASQSSGKKMEFIGTPTRDREAGMVFYKLLNRSDKEIALLGAPYEYEKNQKTGDCIENAIDNQQQIFFTGIWKKEGNVDLLDASTATCKPIIKSADCPEKVLSENIVEGVYGGVECGDLCFISLKLKNKKEFSVLAEQDDVEKLFGSQTGKKVSVTYTTEIKWMDDGVEDPKTGLSGWCDIVSVFKTCKVLGAK